MEDLVENQLRRAEVLADTNRPEAALTLLASVLASDPGSARAQFLAARCLFDLDRLGDSLNAANHAASSAPNWPAPHILRSRIHRQLRDNEGAVAAATTAVNLAPNSADAHVALAQALVSSGQTRRAFEHAHTAVRLAPNASGAHVALSYVAISARRWRECEAAARRALALDPDSSAAMNNLGVALRHRWRPFAALQLFAGASRSNPTGRLSQGNANAVMLRLAGWVLCLVTVSVVLALWLVGSHPQLSHPALVVACAVALALTVAVVAAGIGWFARLPRAARMSLGDTSAWIQTFNGRADGTASVIGRVAWFLLFFFGVPMLFVLVLLWNALRVIQGSAPAGSTLVFPAALLVISILLRSSSVRAARRKGSPPPGPGRYPS
jgi:tetratricopeptide (TPR) repeat protein